MQGNGKLFHHEVVCVTPQSHNNLGITGIAKVTAITDASNVTAVVVKAFGGTDASADWAEGEWSDERGWPTSVSFYEGRLFWAGKDKIIGSVSDSFYSFDATTEGDSGPINRSIGYRAIF